MPLFHIHGLMAATLASLAGGGAVICTPGFNALRFFGLLDAERPSWYTAVPTMHQTILARAERNAEIIARAPLRFIRSSSASLPAQAMKDLSTVFSAPVIESYGMTEASHQMCSNPLPPGAQKPGIVGLPAGPEVAIMDDDGTILPQGEIGEVVIRGPNVTKGYEANPEANAKAFTNGWFRTGDQGMFDADGYLMLTGRLKELIKRGGEKVSPLEVDGVLSEHPAVAQALTFAHPASDAGRGGRRRRRAARGHDGDGTRAARLRGEAPGRLQGAAEGGVPGRDPEGRHRQADAHRPGREARHHGLSAARSVIGTPT